MTKTIGSIFAIIFIFSACTMTSSPSEKPSLQTVISQNGLEFSLETVTPESPRTLKFRDPVNVRVSFKNPNGIAFRFWAIPVQGASFERSISFQESDTITDKQGVLQRWVSLWTSPNEPLTSIRIQASPADQSATLYEGTITNIKYSFSQ
jgi:hypothetical protein